MCRHTKAALGAVSRRKIPDQVICFSCASVGPCQVASRACMHAGVRCVIADAPQTGSCLHRRSQFAAVAIKAAVTISAPPCKTAAARQAYAGMPACTTRGLHLPVLVAFAHLLVSMYEFLKLCHVLFC